jgi:hypothetical protein
MYYKAFRNYQGMVFGLLWTAIVVVVVIIIIVVLLKLVFAIIAIGPMALEHQDIQAISMFTKVPHTLG